VGTLPVKFSYGTCNTVNKEILLCFPEVHKNSCYKYNGKLLQAGISSNFDHFGTSLGIFNGNAVAIGSELPANKVVETMSDNKWIRQDDFPFVSEYISVYSAVNFNENLYIFGKAWPNSSLFFTYSIGGSDGQDTDLAAMFDGKWHQIGKLLQPRRGHRSIVFENSIIHIGGYGQR